MPRPSTDKRTSPRPAAGPAAARPRRAPTREAEAGKGRKSILRTADSPYYQLWVLSNLTAKPFARFGAEFHMNLTDWRIMVTVADHPGITAQELSDYSGLDKMSVSRAVRSLEAQGRLVRDGNEADRRMRHLSLTEQGWAVYNEIAGAAVAREAQIYSLLSARELATLRRLLRKLSQQARASAAMPAGPQNPYSSASSRVSLRPGPSAQASRLHP